MEDKEYINVGDTVNVYWENIHYEMGVVVLFVPLNDGDLWRLKLPKTAFSDEKIILVDRFCKMEKVNS
jgi:hypothetical protein